MEKRGKRKEDPLVKPRPCSSRRTDRGLQFPYSSSRLPEKLNFNFLSQNLDRPPLLLVSSSLAWGLLPGSLTEDVDSSFSILFLFPIFQIFIFIFKFSLAPKHIHPKEKPPPPTSPTRSISLVATHRMCQNGVMYSTFGLFFGFVHFCPY